VTFGGRVGEGRSNGRSIGAAVLRVVLAAALVITGVLVPPAATADAQVSGLQDARNRAADLTSQLDVAAARYEEIWAAVEAATFELEELERRSEQLAESVRIMDERLAARARELFMHGAMTSFDLLLGEGGPADAIERAGLASVLQQRDTAILEEAQATRIALRQTVALTEVRRAELAVLEAEAEAARAAVARELNAAQQRVRSLESLAARQRVIDNARQSGIYSCIMDRRLVSFRDTWGAPRSGGRRHQGTDVMAPFNVPVYAFTSGVVLRRSSSRLGGLGLYLRGDDGATYFYAHLNGYTGAGVAGRRVVAGEHIGYNGFTGNASRSAPHVHFERQPAGGARHNPFPYLVAACR
jgi:murein DD-endopeptidase MepM/ murein hydrolase activator NlpD